jgi:acyl carrier protein
MGIAHVMPLDNGDRKFVLYYTKYGEKHGDVDKTEIQQAIKAAMAKDIPESMRPSILVELEDFPHNPNGKVDRKKLPKPTSDSDFIAPQTDTEHYLHQLWCQMLELEQVSVADNFFELGGHSLMATKLINQINEHYGIAMPLKHLFTASNIADCATLIDQEVEQRDMSQLLAQGHDEDLETDEFVI